MKVSRIKYNVITITLFVIFLATLAITNVTRTSITVVAPAGSYAESFANEKGLKNGVVPDSVSNYFDQRYETFDYNSNETGITIEKYNGKSVDLVIPAFIGNKMVTEISDDFFTALSGVKSVYVPISVSALPEKTVKDIVIKCDKDAKFTKKEKSDWNIDTQYDSDFVNLFLGDCPFLYNKTANGIDVVGYTGDDTTIVIPSYIDGMAVTTVSMAMDGNYDLIIFPETVVNITGNVSTLHMGAGYLLGVFTALVAFALTIIFTNIILGKFSDSKSYPMYLSALVSAYIYLAAQLILSSRIIYYSKPGLKAFIIMSAALMAVFITIEAFACGGAKHSKQVQEKAEAKISVMKELKKKSSGLVDIATDPTVKNKLKQLADELKYSNPSSKPELFDIEQKLSQSIKIIENAVLDKNDETVLEEADKALQFVKIRNSYM